jgi:lysophospholipase L1-like esterase
MRGLRHAVVLVSMLFVLGAAMAAPASAASPVQLSLGDSWAFGVGAAVPSEGGYVPQLHRLLQQRFDCSPSPNPKPNQACKKLQLVNLAVGGATTPTLIANQLPEATSILRDRNGNKNPRDNVEVVTISIGGNDVTNPIIAACVPGLPAMSTGCIAVIQSEFAALRTDLTAALSALREAAGPDARIVIGTYDNPIPTCVLGTVPGANALSLVVLEGGTASVPDGLNDVIRSVAANFGVEVADSFGKLAPQDWLGGQDCLHPVDSGYTKVAQAFYDVLAP